MLAVPVAAGSPMQSKSKRKRGRPPIARELRKEQIGLKLPRWLIDWLDTREESRAELIEDALRTKHRLTPP